MQACQALQDARFARAVGAENRHQLAGIDQQIDLVDHRRCAVVDDQILDEQARIAAAIPGLFARRGLIIGAAQVRGDYLRIATDFSRRT
ncbi:hypothetical protein D3C84_768420 [compost metagenome]